MKEPFKGEEGANIDGASDNDCVGCDDEQEKNGSKEKKKRRKQGRKERLKEELKTKENNFKNIMWSCLLFHKTEQIGDCK